MSLHATFMAAAGIGGLLRAQGEAIEITPKGGQPAPMTALVGNEEAQILNDDRGRKTKRVRTFTITKNPAGEFGGMEDPQENAVVTYDVVDYALKSRKDGVSYWELECDLVGRSERSHGLRK